MILKNISRQNVLSAIDEVDNFGVPAGRVSVKYSLSYNGILYPPKYVISIANRYANGETLDPSLFSGGNESNRFLQKLGFKITGTEYTSKVMEIIAENCPDLARLVIVGDWVGDVTKARKVLGEMIRKWPKDRRVKFTITPAAFVQFDWPEKLFGGIVDSKFPPQEKIDAIIRHAESYLNELLTDQLITDLQKHTDYLSIGIDSFKKKISMSFVQIKKPHVELMALVRLRDKKIFWSGKSYPTTGQQDGLIRITDINSHFVKSEYGVVFLLGCHDLNIFSPRGAAVTKASWRKDAREQLIAMALKEKPVIVLHHPHTTDSSRIWTVAWNELTHQLPSVELYLAAGRYYREDGERSPLELVLASTKKGRSIDFIYKSN